MFDITNKGYIMTAWEELLVAIQTKNSWGKNELTTLIAAILAKHNKD